MSEFMSIKDVMGELKVCRATLYKHLKSGGLISYRVGRLVRITRGDLEEFVKQNRSNLLGRAISQMSAPMTFALPASKSLD